MVYEESFLLGFGVEEKAQNEAAWPSFGSGWRDQ